MFQLSGFYCKRLAWATVNVSCKQKGPCVLLDPSTVGHEQLTVKGHIVVADLRPLSLVLMVIHIRTDPVAIASLRTAPSFKGGMRL